MKPSWQMKILAEKEAAQNSRDAVEEKELPETADRIHKAIYSGTLKAGEGTAEYAAEQPTCTENCKEKTRTGVIKDFPSEFSLAGDINGGFVYGK